MYILQCLIILNFAFSLKAQTEVYWGEAKNESNEIVYFEKHTLIKEMNKLISSETIYFDRSKKTEIARLKSDYSKSLNLPTYEFKDFRRRDKEGLRYENDQYIAFLKKMAKQKKQN